MANYFSNLYFENSESLEFDVPRSTSYGVHNLNLFILLVFSHVDDFNTHTKVLTAKVLKQGYRYQMFPKFYRRDFGLVGLKTSSAWPFGTGILWRLGA